MAEPTERPHLRLPANGQASPFRAPGRNDKKGPLPSRDRAAFGLRLSHELAAAVTQPGAETGEGLYVALDLVADGDTVLRSLEDKRVGARLVQVRDVAGGRIRATVAVPRAGAEKWLRTKIEAYTSRQSSTGVPSNARLVTRIETIRAASLRELFTGPDEQFPTGNAPAWWEVWITKARRAVFDTEAKRLELPVSQKVISFPDVEIVLARATPPEMYALAMATLAVEEVRIPSVGAIVGTGPLFERTLAEDLAARLTGTPGNTAVCLLDNGLNQLHPLLAPAAVPDDMYAYDPAWPTHDLNAQAVGHGTGMAGLALHGDLAVAINQPELPVRHHLESVKVLPDRGQNQPELYGAITRDAVAQPEVVRPGRRRVFCLAVTAGESDGTPSSWSAELDRLCFGDHGRRRVLLVAAGNVAPTTNYPGENDLAPIQEPGQAWNAITVGGFTEKVTIGPDPDWIGRQAVAPAGDLSPSSRTSIFWAAAHKPPVKPDIVMEAGNCATDGSGVDYPENLRLLTTNGRLQAGHFQAFGDTSAATALAARLGAQIVDRYPNAWPETVRGLMIHSAEWTARMRARAPDTTQAARRAVLRRFGYGVPNTVRAIASRAHDACLMLEDSLQPFTAEGKIHEMKLYDLPWPATVLQQLAGTEVEMRVTLSYFIEPKPGGRGRVPKYQYASHRLRFEVKDAHESRERFKSRINSLAEKTPEESRPDRWWLGRKLRHRGSIHSDWWRGDANDLAKRDQVAVYPAGGWWKESGDTSVAARPARFSLLISVRTLNEIANPIDLYAAIRAEIQAKAAVEIES